MYEYTNDYNSRPNGVNQNTAAKREASKEVKRRVE